jgi:hypothetical protein
MSRIRLNQEYRNKIANRMRVHLEQEDTIAKDSCFHFHYLGQVEDRDYDNNPIMKEQNIEEHFDFRLGGSFEGRDSDSYSKDESYGYALYRDELKAQDNCNPDILIEQEGKDHNPHLTKYTDANNKYLGDDTIGYGKQWNEKYQLDLIGRNYCRDRSIACNQEQFMMLKQWKQAKGQFVMAHRNWIKKVFLVITFGMLIVNTQELRLIIL